MRRNTRRLPALLLVILLFLGMLPVTASAANFPSRFYASITLSSNAESFGTVSGNGTYTKTGTTKDRVIYGMESAGGVFFTVEGNRGKTTSQNGSTAMSDDGWRELRVYNSSLNNYQVIGEISQKGGNYPIVDTAIDLSGEAPVLYGTYNYSPATATSMICTIDLETAQTKDWKIVTGLTGEDVIYAIAFDQDGKLYAVGADKSLEGGQARLYTIDPNTGKATQVGEIKSPTNYLISTNFAQDMAFDYTTDTLYWAENKGNDVYTLDTETATATFEGTVKYNNKAYALQSFCIPYDTAFGQNNDQRMISVICAGGGTVTNKNDYGDEEKTFYMVESDNSLTLALTPDENGKLLSVKVDGQSVSVDNLTEYTFNNVTANHVIEVTFRDNLPVTQKDMTWFHYQGYPASFYTQHHAYKFYELPYTTDAPKDGYTQTLLDSEGNEIDDDTVILAGNFDVRVTHDGTNKYNALNVVYEDALQLGKCPGTPGRPVVYGKVGCTQGDLTTISALQDYYGTDGKLIDAAHDDIPVTLVWLNPETKYTEPGYYFANATIYAAQELDQRLKDCYTLDDGEPLEEDCQISSRATQVVILPADEASLIKVQASDDSGGTVSGKGVYKNGDSVTVTATVNTNDGYEFKGWQENGQTVSTEESYSFEASGDRTLTALFEIKDVFRVILKTDPQDGGTVTGGGSYEEGDHSATVKATANKGYYFIGWYADEEQKSTDAEYTFAVAEDGITLTAKFDVDLLSRAELAKDNLESSLGTSVFEWSTLTEAVDAYEKAEEFVEDPPSGVENAESRFNDLTSYYSGVNELDLSDLGISNDDLAELYLFTGVTELNLSGNKGVTSLSNLTNMTKLETLNLSNTVITDLSGLASPTELETLDLSNNTAISDLSILSTLKDLKTLNLSGAKRVTDLSGLCSLGWLRTLDISGTGVTSFDTLVNENGKIPLSSLTTLTAHKLSLTSLSALAKFISEDSYLYMYVDSWDFTDSTLPDTEDNRADVETITGKIIMGEFIPPTIKTAPAPTPNPTPVEHGVVVADCEHGKLAAEPAKAAEGVSVTVTVTPDEGYKLETLTVTDANGAKLELTDKGDGRFEFSMPDCDVSVGAAFVPLRPDYASCTGGTDCPVSAFPDADPTEWYHDGIHFCLDNGMIGGYDNGLMGPHDSLSRAMMVRILFNYEGHPEVSESAAFDDVPDGTWYTDAVNWAAKNGVVEGYGDGRYGPADPITREQLATILYRYAQAKGFDTSVGEETNVLSYSDVGEISEFAMPAMQWACGSGVVEGYDGALRPQGGATRAEAATMLMRFCELYG